MKELLLIQEKNQKLVFLKKNSFKSHKTIIFSSKSEF